MKCGVNAQTSTPNVRSASFKEVFSSVDSFLVPMINAHGVLKTPLGKSFGLEPGITTEFSGTSPLISIGSCPVTSIKLVLKQ